MTKNELRDYIKRQLGWPMVKVELANCQLDDAINLSRNKFIKWAAGNATEDVYITLMLQGDKFMYDLPAGTVDVIAYDDRGFETGINTLFTLENYLYMNGQYGHIGWSPGYGYGLVSYHIALDFLETLWKYTPSEYSYSYHKLTNQLHVRPAPSTGNSLYIPVSAGQNGEDVFMTFDSPGFILLKLQVIQGSLHTTDTTHYINPTYTYSNSTSGHGAYDLDERLEEVLWENDWIQEYSVALSKITLGNIRRKFASFAALGNTSIALDGDSLVSEGKDEKLALEERLKLEEPHMGYGIIVG